MLTVIKLEKLLLVVEKIFSLNYDAKLTECVN